jgi:hypothetical protein
LRARGQKGLTAPVTSSAPAVQFLEPVEDNWADATTDLRFDPLELLERLAGLTPRPRVNLVLYYGVLAPRPRGERRWSRRRPTMWLSRRGEPRWSLTRTPVERHHPGLVGISGPS